MGWTVDEVAPGSPAAFAGLATGFSEVATIAAEVLLDLNSLRGQVDSTIWRGEAADAFASEIGKLPSQLTKLHDSYVLASTSVSVYGRTLVELRQRAAVSCRAGLEAESAEASAQNNRAHAAAADTQLRAATPPDTPAPPPADLSGHDNAIADARNRIAAARSQLSHIAEERKSAETTLVAGLQDASAEGIRNDPWWRKALVSTLRFVGSACRFVAIVLVIIAVIIIIGFMLFSGLGLLAGFLVGLAYTSTILAVATAFQAAALASDAGLKVMGETDRSWGSMALEGVLLALPLIGSKASPFLSKLALGERLAQRSTIVANISSKFATANAEAAAFLAKPGTARTAKELFNRKVAGSTDDIAGTKDELVEVADDLAGATDDFGRNATANGSNDLALRSQGDPMLSIQGPGKGSPEFDDLVTKLEAAGFEVEIRTGSLAYSPAKGSPGKILLDPDASLSALRHEALHATDDAANGFPGMGYYLENPTARWTMEFNAYRQEIASARELGRYDIARKLLQNARAERLELLGY